MLGTYGGNGSACHTSTLTEEGSKLQQNRTATSILYNYNTLQIKVNNPVLNTMLMLLPLFWTISYKIPEKRGEGGEKRRREDVSELEEEQEEQRIADGRKPNQLLRQS